MSFFKSKRISGDSKPSSKSGIDSESKTQKNSGTPSSKSSGAMPVSATAAAGGSALNSKQSNSTPTVGKVGRSRSIDASAWAEMECPIDSRIMASTVSDKTLSISRSGRYKAKGKVRARLFSDGLLDATTTDNPDADKRGAGTPFAPEDRQTVLQQAMTIKSGTPSGRCQIKSDITSPKWSTTSNSMDL